VLPRALAVIALVALIVALPTGARDWIGPPPAGERDREAVRPPTEGLLWKADASRPVHEEWANYATADVCFESRNPRTSPTTTSSRVVQSTEVHPPNEERSYLMRLEDGDECAGERTELAQSNPPKDGFEDRVFNRGDDLWIGYQFLIPTGRFQSASTWNCLVQLKGEGEGGPLFCPSLIEERLGLGHINSREQAGVGGYDLWRHDRPVVRDRWIKFLFHVRFDPDPDVGFVEFFADLADGEGMRVRVPHRSLFTMKVRPDGTPTPVHARIGIYRDRAVVGDAEMYYAGFAVGRNREVVEYEAFGMLPERGPGTAAAESR
jgi:hypothetical protein